MEHNRYAAVILALLFISSPLFLNAASVGPGLPFGGRVVFEITCDTGLLLTVLTPMSGPIQLMWLTGELPFNMHVVPHIGQNMIGWDLPGSMQCYVGPEVVGSGNLIIMHGDSI